MNNEELIVYGFTTAFCLAVVLLYLFKGKKQTKTTLYKVQEAKKGGRFEPVSLHPFIDINSCISSGACIEACPEKDIIGLVNGRATVINASQCIGHGACFHACPVEAISLRIGTETRGVELPHVNANYETNVKGIFIAGELGGMGLIKNSVEQGRLAVDAIASTITAQKEGLYDLVVIGAGPAGIAATLNAKKHQLKAITLEQDTLGGTVFTFPRSKIVMTNPMDLPLFGKVKLFKTSKSKLLEVWKEALLKNNLTIQEQCKVENIIQTNEGEFDVITKAGVTYKTQRVLIAIGRRGSPRKLGIPGETAENVAYRLLEPENIKGKKIVVVGGGDAAIESAMLLMEENEVILSYRKHQFARLKAKNEESIFKAMEAKKINVLFSSELKQIQSNSVHIAFEEQVQEMPNDLVYIFAGGELPTAFLQNSGIEISKRFGQIMKKH